MTKTKLLKICKVVREHLGLGDLRFEYQFVPDDGDLTFADSMIFYSGWSIRIQFYDLFFKRSLDQQLETIVHEHLHAMYMPADQASIRGKSLVVKKYLETYEETTSIGREIAVDHATGPILKLLMPHIRKVL